LTVKVELHETSAVHESLALNVKLKLTPLPQSKLGKAGISATLDVGLSPSFTLKPAAQRA
jgi:hypothetical protein